MNNEGIKYEDLTQEQRFDYGLQMLSEKDLERMKKGPRIEYVPVKRPIMGD